MKSPFRIVFIFITLACLGIGSLPYLAVDFLPKTQSTTLILKVGWPNASPVLMESQVVQLIENVCSGITGLHHINSVSFYDKAEISLEFKPKADMAMVRFELASIIRRIYPDLPLGVTYPIFDLQSGQNQKENEADRPILVYSINAPEQPFAIKSKAEEIFRKALSEFNDLKEIRLSGTEDLQVTIQFDLNRCAAYKVAPQDILQYLAIHHKVTYPGTLKSIDGLEYFIRINHQSLDLKSLEQLIIPIGVNRLQLKDIARIYLEDQPVNRYFRINGKNSIHLMLFARDRSNRVVLAETLKSKVNFLLASLPAGYELHLDTDDSLFLKEELNKNYRRSLMALAILVVFLLISYRSWRYLLILMASLIINLALTALACYFLKISIHLYSIAGLSISYGIMIDNSIVTLDYYHQYRSRHMFLAVLAATLTTIVSLLFVFLLPDELKQNLTDFVAIVSVALGTSLLVSLAFTPALYMLVHGQKAKDKTSDTISWNHSKSENFYYQFIYLLQKFRKSFTLLMILMFGLPIFLLPYNWAGHTYYNKTFGSEWYLEHLRPIVDRVLGGTLRLFIRDVYEKSGYRDPQRTRLYISAQMKYGTTIEQMNTILTQFEKYLEGITGVDQYSTNIYSGQSGFIEIGFTKEYENSALPWQLKSRLTAKATDWSAVEWAIYGVGQGFSTYGNEQIPSYRVLMKGYNNEELEIQANVLKEKLMQHPRVQKVNTNERLNWSERASWEYVLALKENTMASYQITKEQLFSKINDISQTKLTGQMLTLNGKPYPIVLKESGSSDYDLWDMTNVPLQVDTQATFKLNQLSNLVLTPTASALHKEDRQYIRLVAFEYLGSDHFGSEYLDKVLDQMKKQLPLGYTADRHTWRWGSSDQAKPYWLLGLIILSIFFICALMFESLKLPFYIILMIPLSFVGLFLIFIWGDFYFDQGGYAAFVMLAGLVVNAAIFIVHDFQQAIRQVAHVDYNRLLIKVVSNRARTILLTTVSAICGLLPFIWEGQKEVFWFSLAVGVMGGLVFSMYAVFVVLVVLLWKRVGVSA